ncbi:MAG: T9SS type A sorting domain-containing protein [Bacteroidetes bacterium]|nr:T9SS type A sorting domain-containing protein [Bacteroidota bacterium]
MRTMILFFYLVPLFISYSQEIFLSKDTMSIGNNNFVDSMIIYNKGMAELRIDSIKCGNTNYALNTDPAGDKTKWKWLYEYVNPKNAIRIDPRDSLKVRLTVAAVLTKLSHVYYDQIDTMNFYNNSTNLPVRSIRIYNKVIMGDVDKETMPSEYKVYQNYPNPFNPSTRIDYELPTAVNVVIKVYDWLGEEITTLVNKYQTSGSYSVLFNGKDLSSGVYFYKIIVDEYSTVRKMILLK